MSELSAREKRLPLSGTAKTVSSVIARASCSRAPHRVLIRMSLNDMSVMGSSGSPFISIDRSVFATDMFSTSISRIRGMGPVFFMIESS